MVEKQYIDLVVRLTDEKNRGLTPKGFQELIDARTGRKKLNKQYFYGGKPDAKDTAKYIKSLANEKLKDKTAVDFKSMTQEEIGEHNKLYNELSFLASHSLKVANSIIKDQEELDKEIDEAESKLKSINTNAAHVFNPNKITNLPYVNQRLPIPDTDDVGKYGRKNIGKNISEDVEIIADSVKENPGFKTYGWGEAEKHRNTTMDYLLKPMRELKSQYKSGELLKIWKDEGKIAARGILDGLAGKARKGPIKGLFGVIGKIFRFIKDTIKKLIAKAINIALQYGHIIVTKAIKIAFKPFFITMKTLKSLFKTALSKSQAFKAFMESAVIPFVIALEYTLLPVLKILLPYISRFVKIISDNKDVFLYIGRIIGSVLNLILYPIEESLKGIKNGKDPVSALFEGLATGMERVGNWLIMNKSKLEKFLYDVVVSLLHLLKNSMPIAAVLVQTLKEVLIDIGKTGLLKEVFTMFKDVTNAILVAIGDVLQDPNISSVIQDILRQLIGMFINAALNALSQIPIIGLFFKPFAALSNIAMRNGNPYARQISFAEAHGYADRKEIEYIQEHREELEKMYMDNRKDYSSKVNSQFNTWINNQNGLANTSQFNTTPSIRGFAQW